MTRLRVLGTKAGATAILLMVLTFTLQFATVGAADVLDPVTSSTDPLIEPLPDPTLPPLPEDPVGEVVGTVEDTLSPPQDEEPTGGDGGSQPEPEPDPTTQPTTPPGGSDSGTSTSTINSSSTTVAALDETGASPANLPEQASPVAGAAVGGPMTTVLRSSGDPDPIQARPTAYGPRSTKRVLELMQALRLPPATIARILAPFPVAGPASYGDDWAQPRFEPYFHVHEGTDIFAESGTPVISSAEGTVTDLVPISAVGGTTLRITAPDGTYFYYAHLSGFAPGLFEGKSVALGEVVGFVGTSGNAEGTEPHLHYEIHPNGGAAVPPVPYLDRWLEEALQAAQALKASPSSGLSGLVQRIPWALNGQAQNLADHLTGTDPMGASSTATVGGWAAILGLIAARVASRRRKRKTDLFAAGFLKL